MGYNTSTATVPSLRRSTTCPAIVMESSRLEGKKRRRHSWSGTSTRIINPVIIPEDRSENGTSSTGRRADEEYMRKAQAVLKGGAMFGVGLVMIPLPVPMGVVVAGAGLSVLGKEFPVVQDFLDQTRGAISGVWAKKKEPTVVVVEEEVEFDGDYSLTEIDFSSLDQPEIVECASDAEEEVIFSSVLNNSEVLRPAEDVFVSVWTA